MKKIKRNISLENFKSRYPGLLPYFKVKDQSVYICTVSGDQEGSPVWPENSGVEYGCDPVNGNWGEIPLNFRKDPEGPLYVYGEMNLRYNRMRGQMKDAICLELFIHRGEKRWRLCSMPYGEDRRHAVTVSPEYFKRAGVKDILYVLDNYGYLKNDHEDADEATKVIVVAGKKSFDDDGGVSFMQEFERYLGILEVRPDIQGKHVPKYIPIWRIKDQLAWMERNRNIREENTKRRWRELGGTRMIDFLNENEDLFDDVMKDISGFYYEFPDLSLSILLENKMDTLGIYTPVEKEKKEVPEDDTATRYEKAKGVRGESRLIELKSRFVSFDDKGKELPGELAKKINEEGQYILKRDGSGLSGGYSKDSYETEAPTMSNAYYMLQENNKAIVRVEYDNGVVFEKKDAPKEKYVRLYRKNGEDIEEWYDEGGKSRIVEKYDGRDLPENVSKEILYYANNNIFVPGSDEPCIRKKKYFSYDNDLGKWSEEIRPSKIICVLKKDEGDGSGDYFEVSENDSIKRYGLPSCRLEGFIGADYYKGVITSADIPYVEGSVFNDVETGGTEGEKMADYLKTVRVSEDEEKVSFEYFISSKMTLKEDKYVIDENTGIEYKETHALKKGVPVSCSFDERDITCYFDVVDMTSSTDVVHNEHGLERRAVLSTLSYIPGYVDKFEDMVPVKEDALMGVDHVNTPQINVKVARGNAEAFERRYKLMECNTFQDLQNYGNNYFKID